MSLEGRVVLIAQLSFPQKQALYNLFVNYYDCVCRSDFLSDLEEKDYILLLHETKTNRLCGFSTQKILSTCVDGQSIDVIFSGDTIIAQDFWGNQELVRVWCRFAGSVHAERKHRLYWFLICKGYRTYLYLPIFFHDYAPRYDRPTPASEQNMMHRLAHDRFGKNYSPDTGLVTFPVSRGQLTKPMAAIPRNRLQDPRTRFFLNRNPTYAEGTELVCLTKLDVTNMKGLARRLFEEGQRRGSLKALQDGQEQIHVPEELLVHRS